MTAWPIPVSWQPRPKPLAAAAAVALGEAAELLARRLLTESREELACRSGVAGPGFLLVLAAAGELPWVDGVVYLGRDPEAPALLLPVHRRPAVPLPLFERALLKAFPATRPPVAVLWEPAVCASVAAARPIVRESLVRWLEERT
jgi:hypothetical protein